MIIGYLDNNQRNISIEQQQNNVTKYAHDNLYDVCAFFNNIDIKNIVNSIISKNNTIIVANIACLGNKLAIIVENIEFLISNGFELISVKENLKFDSSKETQHLLNGLRLSIEIRNSMVSTITGNALKKRKDEGKVLGRCVGYRSSCTILERNKDKITQMYHEGKTKKQIADEFGCSVGLIFQYLRDNPEIKMIKDKDGNIVEHKVLNRNRTSKLDKQKDTIIKMYHEGKTKKQIAYAVGCTPETIFKYLRAHPEIKKAKGETSND